MAEIPTPSESGVSGTQLPGPAAGEIIDATPPTHGLPITQVVEGLAASKPRSLGGEASAALIAGAMTHLSHDLRTAQRALLDKDERIQQLQGELSASQVRAARLQERLGALATVQRLKQFSIFAGTGILGVAASLYTSNAEKTSYVLALIGCGLLAFGWFTGKPGGDE